MGTQSSCDACSCCMWEDGGKTSLPVSKKDGWKGGGREKWRMSPSAVLLVHDGLFRSSVGPGCSLTHSFIHPVICVRGFLDLCIRFTHSVRPLLTGILTCMLFLCNIFQWGYLSFSVFPSLSRFLSVWEQTLIHTRTHTLWLTNACSASVSVSISTLPPCRLSFSLSLSLFAAVPLQAGSRFHQEKNPANQNQSEPPTHHPSLCKLSFSQSPSISLFYSDSLSQTVNRCKRTHFVWFVIVFFLDHSHVLSPRWKYCKQPGDMLRDAIQKHTIQIVMLKGWQLPCKNGVQNRCKMSKEDRGSTVVHYLSVWRRNSMEDAGTWGLCYITDWDFPCAVLHIIHSTESEILYSCANAWKSTRIWI